MGLFGRWFIDIQDVLRVQCVFFRVQILHAYTYRGLIGFISIWFGGV